MRSVQALCVQTVGPNRLLVWGHLTFPIGDREDRSQTHTDGESFGERRVLRDYSKEVGQEWLSLGMACSEGDIGAEFRVEGGSGSSACVWEGFMVRGNSSCKGPEVEVSLACLWRRGDSVA